VQVWREGQTLELKVKAGRLGVTPAKGAAAEAIKAAREADALLAGLSRGPTLAPLPGTRREVEAIAPLFPESRKLLGSDANCATLRQMARYGTLAKFDVIHLATHGLTDPYVAYHSAVVLSQAADDPGKLMAMEMKDWKLDADLVVLSACESGLGKYGGGDGYLGFTQALFLAGARSVVLSLWKVDDDATALLMVRFYQNLQRAGSHDRRAGSRERPEPLSKAEALREAKLWLRSLSAEEIQRQVAALPTGSRVGTETAKPRETAKPGRRFDHPYYWAGFILIGDPE
jgi:CHAT domain-containing protein